MPYILLAQVNHLGVLNMDNGMLLFQDAYDEDAYYYLPKAPRLVRNEDSTFQTALVKYIDVEQNISGAYFSAILEYQLDAAEVKNLEKELKSKNKKAFIKGQLPLYTFKDDARYGNTSFKLVSSTFSTKNTMTNKVITSGHAPLQPGARTAIMMELSKQGASLLEQSLLQETSDLNVLMTAYYPALTPSFLAKISVPSQELTQIFQNNFHRKTMNSSEIQQLMQSKEMNHLLNIEIFDEKKDAKRKGKVTEIIQLFTEQLIDRFFEPVIGNCTDEKSKAACLQLKNNPRINGDSIQIVLQSNSIIKVPIILAGNIGGFIKTEKDKTQYIKTIHLNKDFIGEQRSIVVKVDEHYLEAFDSCLKGVAVKVKNNTSARPIELSFNWAEIKSGQYKKQIQLRFQNPEDTLYYQIAWDFAKTDTTIISPWLASIHPFITLVPPLEKRVIDVFFQGNKKTAVKKIIVEFAGKLGQKPKGKIINKIVLDNTGIFQTKSLTVFTDLGSYIRYRPRWYFHDKEEFKQKSKLLQTDNFIWLNLRDEE
ncbi:MAG: hypothetical protein ACI85O_000680 [Saprospiraceae bacterium]|jgi:hypothetical protein